MLEQISVAAAVLGTEETTILAVASESEEQIGQRMIEIVGKQDVTEIHGKENIAKSIIFELDIILMHDRERLNGPVFQGGKHLADSLAGSVRVKLESAPRYLDEISKIISMQTQAFAIAPDIDAAPYGFQTMIAEQYHGGPMSFTYFMELLNYTIKIAVQHEHSRVVIELPV